MACDCTPAFGCNSPSVLVFDENSVAVYADRVGAQGGTNNWIRCLAIICLRANRLLYQKKTADDCGTATIPQLTGAGKAASVATSIASTALGPLGGILAGAGQSSGLGLLSIFTHHAQAVATEQGTICDVSLNWAGFAQAVEQALQQSQIGLQDAITKLDQLHKSLTSELATVSNPVQKNAGYGYTKALDALTLFNKEAVYPSLVPGVVASLLGSTAVGKAVSSMTSSKTGTGALVIGGGVVAAKVLGVF